MKKYVIERNLPGIGNLSQAELQDGSQNSNKVIRDLKNEVQWVQSYITGDKVYCVYLAPNPEMLQEHAQRSGVPADRISEVTTIIDPTTAGG